MKRKKVSRKLDRRIFSSTADKTKAVNLPSVNYRGGVRF